MKMPETTLEWITAIFSGVIALILGFCLPLFIYAWPLVLVVLVIVGFQVGLSELLSKPFQRKPTELDRQRAKADRAWLLPPVLGGLIVGAGAGFMRYGFSVGG